MATKKTLFISLALVCALLLSACTGGAQTPADASQSAAPVTPEATLEPAATEPVLGGVADPADMSATDASLSDANDIPVAAASASDALDEEEQRLVDAMHPVFDSQIRYMHEHDIDYIDFSSPEAVWSTLYYLCVNFGPADSRVAFDSENATVPKNVMLEYMLANFELLGELPELPSDSAIKYDKSTDAYTMPLSDASESYSRILSAKPLANGVDEVQLGYFEMSGDGEDALIKAYSFYVTHRSELDSASDAPYKLTVSTMFISYTNAIMISAIEEKIDATYMTVEYLDEIWHIADQTEPDGTINAYDWLELKPTGRTEQVRVSPNAEFEAGMLSELVGETVDADMDSAAAREYFLAKCTSLLSDMPIYFDANIIEGVLYGADVMFDAYFAG